MLTFSSGGGSSGLINTAINKLPIELHLPSYRFCGPGTRLKERLARGDVGINPLDEACKEHDIAYSRNVNLSERHKADEVLAKKALSLAKNSPSLKERAAAVLIAGAMKAKTKLGLGAVRRKKVQKNKKRSKIGRGDRITFKNVLGRARAAMKPAKTTKTAITLALRGARSAVKNNNKKKRAELLAAARIIPIPKVGGILPLIPLFAGLSALGALTGGAAGVAKAVSDASAAKQTLKEAERHNKTMEAIALRGGKGMFLKPYKRGFGLVLTPKNCLAER